MDENTPEWSHTVKDIRQIGDLLTVIVALTIGGITREGIGTGTAETELGIKKAEHDALKRAAVKFGVGRELVDAIRTHQITQTVPKQKSFYSLEQFESKTPFCMLVDEIEDTVSGLTAYTLSTMFRLVEKAQAHRQQLIVTSNRSLENLLEFWTERDRRFLKGEADAENYCAKIDRRLQEHCVVLEIR